MPDTFSVSIDFDNDGYGLNDDITPYVRTVSIRLGLSDPLARIANIGVCTLTLNNPPPALPFSPNSSSGPFTGKLLPRKPIHVQVSDGNSTYTAFTGFTHKFLPASGKNLEGQRFARIECYDLLGLLQKAKVSAPLLLNQRADQLVPVVLNSALSAPAAIGTLTLSKNPADGDTVTINGTTYTFKTTLSATPNQILISARREDTAANLVAAIGGGYGSGTIYSTNTTRPAGVIASYTPELPSRATCWHDQARVIQGGALTYALSGPYSEISFQASAALNDSFSHAIFLQAGTYTFSTLGSSDTQRGIVSWALDGSTFAAQDWYSASPISPVLKTAPVTIPNDGYHTLTGTIMGKNASSTGYFLYLTKYWLNKASD